MIKSITVHPKGATHFQVFSGNTYFIKQEGGVWLFRTRSSPKWIEDEILNSSKHASHSFAKSRLTKIGTTYVPDASPVRMPTVVVHSNMEVIF